MAALVLRLREQPPERLDLSALVPHKLAGLSSSEIERLVVGTSRFGVRVGDVFGVEAGEAAEIRFLGGSTRLDRVGHAMEGGRIFVEGDVGQRLGIGMRRGEIEVGGNAGPFAASAATGGIVRIAGSAEEAAGGAVYGAMHGLDGGTLVIGKDAGPRLGDSMRRGLIIVGGGAGAYAGARLIAGTIVAGTIGDHPGYGMRRGMIFTRSHGQLLPSFVPIGRQRLVVTRLIRRAVGEIRPASAEIITDEMLGFAGDLATIGKGVVLVSPN
ncbi:Formyltransferase/hydrolase complex Fhc subunit C [Labrys miyagiensis]